MINTIFYLIHHETINTEISYQLKSQCINNFLASNSISSNYILTQYSKGKPYIELPNKITIPISVSHTKNHFVMCFSDCLCGIDIELKNKKINTSRFKSWLCPNEIKMINQNLTTLPQLWTIKESYSKLLGIGILKGRYLMDTVEDLQQKTLIKQKGNVIFNPIHLNSELYCTLAIYRHHSKSEPEIRIIRL